MKHRKKVLKLGRMSSHRFAMLYNMAGSLIVHKKIHTTVPKAKAVVPTVSKLITWAKEGTLHARRLAFSILKDKDIVKILFDEVAKTMANRPGGYTRIIKAGFRPGDGAPMAILELVGFENVVAEQPKTKEEKKKIKEEAKKAEKREEKVKAKSKKETK